VNLASDAFFFLLRAALALIIACGLLLLGISAAAAQVREWLLP
jgi:hypothetical protein